MPGTTRDSIRLSDILREELRRRPVATSLATPRALSYEDVLRAFPVRARGSLENPFVEGSFPISEELRLRLEGGKEGGGGRGLATLMGRF